MIDEVGILNDTCLFTMTVEVSNMLHDIFWFPIDFWFPIEFFLEW